MSVGKASIPNSALCFWSLLLYGLDSRDSNTQATKNRTKILAEQAESSSNSHLHGGAWLYLILARKKSVTPKRSEGLQSRYQVSTDRGSRPSPRSGLDGPREEIGGTGSHHSGNGHGEWLTRLTFMVTGHWLRFSWKKPGIGLSR